MTRFRIYAVEALRELRDGFRSPLVPLMFVGLVGYIFLTVLSAEYVRQLGASGIARNSPHVVTLMTSGQAFWLIFAWAWVFAQVVSRDRTAHLHEVVLSAPVSLRGLLVARYIGALGLACVLGSATAVGFLLVPLFGLMGILPAEAVGPAPIAAMAWSWLLFVLPTAAGLGALYLVAALRTRSTFGPFAAAALIAFVWMFSMVVLRDGQIRPELATLLDPSGFGECEHQTAHWTPHEKTTRLLVLTAPLLANRVLWTVLPLSLLGFVLMRVKRESLVLERASKSEVSREPREGSSPVTPSLGPVTNPSWTRALLAEAVWHVSVSMQGWGFRIAVVLWALVGVFGTYAHMIAHAEGPFVPRAELLAPFLLKLSYVFIVFIIAGFVGAVSRRDQRLGFEEMVDAAPAPLRIRVLGRALAVSALTVGFSLVPTLSAWIVMALEVRESFNAWDPFVFNLLVASPALLELAACTFFIHALVRSAGTAYALSMLVAFIAILNHELVLVPYPPAQLGLPAPIELSELAGWSPWVWPVLAADAFKFGIVVLFVAVAWLVWSRGTAVRGLERLRALFARGRGGAGAFAAAGAVGVFAFGALLHDRLAVRGDYASPVEKDTADAAFERRFWSEAAGFSVQGGDVRADINPFTRSARVRWKLEGVQANGPRLQGELTHGMRIERALVAGQSRSLIVEADHFALDLGGCVAAGCEVELELTIEAQGFPVEHTPPWLDTSGVWARATDLLPRLGFDPERALRAPAIRRSFGLPEKPGLLPPGSGVPALAVAPAGVWRWDVRFADGGVHTTATGSADGPLDFAVAWLPGAPARTELAGTVAWHGAMRLGPAKEILRDLADMRPCVEARLGSAPAITTVLQAPRGLGEVTAYSPVLWIPEHEGWDVGSKGYGHSRRRATIAQSLAARVVAERADLRAEPGARWLLDGVAGWVGLECVRRTDGAAAWFALWSRQNEKVVQALGALDAPVTGLSSDGEADWVAAYAPLATLGWAETVGEREATRVVGEVLDRVRAGVPLREALSAAAGTERAAQLLDLPSASDVAVTAGRHSALAIAGRRWGWEGGGWQSQATSPEVVRLPNDVRSAPQIAASPATLEASNPFSVVDAWPSFERSPEDNIWPRSKENHRR